MCFRVGGGDSQPGIPGGGGQMTWSELYTPVVSLYSAQLTIVHQFILSIFLGQKKKNTTHLYLKAGEALGVRMHNYHSLTSSHENWIVVGSLRNLNLTLIFTAEQNIKLFSRYSDNKHTRLKKLLFPVSTLLRLRTKIIRANDKNEINPI